jgi:transposase-like protein
MSYPVEYREAMVRRMIGPEGRSAHQLSRDTGIPRSTLCRWRREVLSVDWMERDKDPKQRPPRMRPRDWPAQEKLRVVLEAAALSDEELGALLRREGVHEAQLAEWRASALSGALESLSGNKPKAPAPSTQVRDLQRELRRKEKALAEAAALLVLRGKMQALWGEEGDDTTED